MSIYLQDRDCCCCWFSVTADVVPSQRSTRERNPQRTEMVIVSMLPSTAFRRLVQARQKSCYSGVYSNIDTPTHQEMLSWTSLQQQC